MKTRQNLMISVAIATALLTANAHADGAYIDIHSEFLGGGSLNLGEQLGEPRDDGNDLAPGQLGLVFGAGIVRGKLELGAEASLAVGGLDLERIETVYFESEPANVGSSMTLAAGAGVRYLAYSRDRIHVPVGMRLGWQRFAAASPAGNGRADAFYLELGVGIARQVRPGGRIELTALLRSSRVLQVSVASGGDQFATPEDPAIIARAGAALGYTQRF